MTDLEIVKACAVAMGYPEHHFKAFVPDLAIGDCAIWIKEVDAFNGKAHITYTPHVYDPLHDDAQAMALVKKFPSHTVAAMLRELHPANDKPDFNRAICLCVATMQAGQGAT